MPVFVVFSSWPLLALISVFGHTFRAHLFEFLSVLSHLIVCDRVCCFPLVLLSNLRVKFHYFPSFFLCIFFVFLVRLFQIVSGQRFDLFFVLAVLVCQVFRYAIPLLSPSGIHCL